MRGKSTSRPPIPSCRRSPHLSTTIQSDTSACAKQTRGRISPKPDLLSSIKLPDFNSPPNYKLCHFLLSTMLHMLFPHHATSRVQHQLCASQRLSSLSAKRIMRFSSKEYDNLSPGWQTWGFPRRYVIIRFSLQFLPNTPKISEGRVRRAPTNKPRVYLEFERLPKAFSRQRSEICCCRAIGRDLFHVISLIFLLDNPGVSCLKWLISVILRSRCTTSVQRPSLQTNAPYASRYHVIDSARELQT
ncbi:hypothetical protein B0J14DRAFT_171048 [Halenospora varia]|nr:hypothetical protein B0J14DRAFT_171048 [Halenospora varia]